MVSVGVVLIIVGVFLAEEAIRQQRRARRPSTQSQQFFTETYCILGLAVGCIFVIAGLGLILFDLASG